MSQQEARATDKPLWHNVIVKMDPIQKQSDGGIILIEETTERDEMLQTKGTIVALGPRAFEDGDSEFVNGELIKKPLDVPIGTRVEIQEFVGQTDTERQKLYEERYILLRDTQIHKILVE